MLESYTRKTIHKSSIGPRGHVGHTQYSPLLEMGEDKFLEERSLSFPLIESQFDLSCVQRSFSIEFIKPLFLDDEIVIETKLTSIGTTSFSIEQSIKKGDLIVTVAHTVYVAVRNGKSEKIPLEMRNRLTIDTPSIV